MGYTFTRVGEGQALMFGVGRDPKPATSSPTPRSGPHDVRNGLLLRSDLHNLFDQGYLTVTLDFNVEVSRRIREEFENGRDYYVLHGKPLTVPSHEDSRPAREFLEWHNGIFKG